MKKRVFSLILAVGMVCALAVPVSAATSYYEASLRGMADYYFGIGDMDAYNKTMKELEEYLADNADQKDETATPTTKPETPEISEPSEMPTFQHYADVSNDAWYAEAVNAMTEGGLLKGYDDGLFHPNDIITGGELATILCRIGGEDPSNDYFYPYESGGETYLEPQNWAHHAMQMCGQMGYYGVNMAYQYNIQVVRGEAIERLAALAYRCIPTYHENNDRHAPTIQVSEKVWTESDIPDLDFEEIYQSNHFAKTGAQGVVSPDFIVLGYNLGIVQGVDALGNCKPFEPISRAELCQMLYNMGIVRESCVSMWGNTAYLYEGQINPGPRQTTAD